MLNFLTKLLRAWCWQSGKHNSLEVGSLLAIAYGYGKADEVVRVWFDVFDSRQLELVGLVSSFF